MERISSRYSFAQRVRLARIAIIKAKTFSPPKALKRRGQSRGRAGF
jgi:hypothetical protein